MASGRCAGCGFSAALRRVRAHVLSCPEYLHLHRTEPGRALDPEAELERYRAEDDSPTARAQRRDDRLRLQFAEMDERQARQAQRWKTPPDLLAD